MGEKVQDSLLTDLNKLENLIPPGSKNFVGNKVSILGFTHIICKEHDLVFENYFILQTGGHHIISRVKKKKN